jgi:hypothetical protein
MSYGVVVPIPPTAELTVYWNALLATREVRALAPHLVNALTHAVVIAKLPQWCKAVVAMYTLFE